MNWIDLGILAAFIISIVLGVSRGFVREAFSLAAWLTASLCARLWAPKLALLLPDSIESIGIRLAISSVILFILTFVVGNMIGRLLKQAVNSSGLGSVDHLLGALFGSARAVIILLLVVIVIDWLGWFEKTLTWQTSKGLPYFLALEDWFLNFVKIKLAF